MLIQVQFGRGSIAKLQTGRRGVHIYIYRPYTTQLMVRIFTTQRYKGLIVNAINFSQITVNVKNSTSKLMVTVVTTTKFTIVRNAQQLNTMCDNSVLFELVSTLTTYFGGSNCGKCASGLRRWVDQECHLQLQPQIIHR